MEKFRLSRTQAIGMFVLLTLIATFAVVNFLRGEDIFNRSRSYNAVFENVDGLTVTGPIYIRGLKVGMVEAIEYNMDKDAFDVEFKVKSQFKIPVNSVAEIYSADIMGTRAVRISMGDAKEYASSGDTLASAIVPDMVAALTKDLAPLSAKAAELLDNVNRTLDNVNRLLDSSARADLQSAAGNLDKTLANAVAISGTLKDVAPEIKEIMQNLQTLSAGLGASAGEIESTLSNVNKITGELSQAELDKTVEALRGLLEKLQDPEGTVGKLMATDTLHNAVNTLLNDVDILVKRITENPKKYIKVSVF